MKVKIGQVEISVDPNSGVQFQRVPFEVCDDAGGVLMSRIQSFPLSASSAEIRADLVRAANVYRQDVERYEGTKELQAGIENASVVAEEISGGELSV